MTQIILLIFLGTIIGGLLSMMIIVLIESKWSRIK
jgi:phosphate/sulfate permease